MTSKSKDLIKAFFETGDKPTEAQFIDLIDSYVDKSGPMGQIETVASAGQTGFAFVSGMRGEIYNNNQAREAMGITVYTTANAAPAVLSLIATTAEATAGLSESTLMTPALTAAVTRGIVATATDTTFGITKYATTADSQGGSVVDRALTPSSFKGAIGFAKYYESTQQVLTASGLLTLPHSLGRIPILVKYVLQCTTAEFGYSIGDEATEILPGYNSSNTGVSIVPDATNISVRYGAGAQVFVVLRKDTGVVTNITPASWRLVIRAWA
jgi:hypothetical protein